MANVTTTQILVDGVHVVESKTLATLNTSDLAYSIILDPSTLAAVTNDGNLTKATTLRIRRIISNIQDGFTVQLYWDVDGTLGNAVLIENMSGRLDMQYERKIGALKNNAPGGGTGKIGIATTGYATGSTSAFSLILECSKF